VLSLCASSKKKKTQTQGVLGGSAAAGQARSASEMGTLWKKEASLQGKAAGKGWNNEFVFHFGFLRRAVKTREFWREENRGNDRRVFVV